jgi:hypothetical protein
MAQIITYPKGTPKNADYLLGTSTPATNTDDLPVTKNFAISDVSKLVSKGYKSYVARFGRNASVIPDGEITELYNDTGLTFTWSVNNSEGVLDIEASSDLGTKVVCFTSCGSNNPPAGGGFPYQFDFKRSTYNNGSNIAMFCRKSNTNDAVTTYFGSIEIKIYD